MTPQDQDLIFADIMAKCNEVLKSKRNDYASDADVLSNFKNTAAQMKLTPEQVCTMFISVKVSRLVELFSGKKERNESIEDNMTDLINYAILLKMIRIEKK